MTVGDEVKLECSGFGVPVPALAFTFPTNVTSDDEIKKRIKKGKVNIKFTAAENLSGRYQCTGGNKYGTKKDWVDVVGMTFRKSFYLSNSSIWYVIMNIWFS